jgi:hypothetical protein
VAAAVAGVEEDGLGGGAVGEERERGGEEKVLHGVAGWWLVFLAPF